VSRPAALPSRGALVAIWAGVAAVFGLLLAVADGARGPLDDTDPARQRPGLLDLGALPAPAPQVVAGVPAPGRRAVVFFVRPSGLEPLCRALGERPLDPDVDVVAIVGAGGGRCPLTVAVVVDPTAAYARRFGLPAPRDGGPPVGYAVVDSAGRTRYRTLDPQVAEGLREVATIVAAVP
jgi:hypothetical protein